MWPDLVCLAVSVRGGALLRSSTSVSPHQLGVNYPSHGTHLLDTVHTTTRGRTKSGSGSHSDSQQYPKQQQVTCNGGLWSGSRHAKSCFCPNRNVLLVPCARSGSSEGFLHVRRQHHAAGLINSVPAHPSSPGLSLLSALHHDR